MAFDCNTVPDLYQKGEQIIEKGADRYYCRTCRKTMAPNQFFKTGRKVKFPKGLLPECKSCITMRVDDADPDTFLSILKEIDVPYIPSEWRILQQKKSEGQGSILGKYIAKMHLNQYKRYNWESTNRLVEEENAALLEVLRLDSDSEEEAQQRAAKAAALIPTSNPIGKITAPAVSEMYGLTPETSKYCLTQEEIDELRRNWGSDYSEDEYFSLEQMFSDMNDAYIITDPISISNARLICKMTLKMNKFLDVDDMESVARVSRQLDLFIKTANLAPVQQKDRQQTTFAISQLAYLVEREGGFIPEYYIPEPNDQIDAIIADMKTYTARLIRGESGIAEMLANTEAILAQDKLPEAVAGVEAELDAFEREVEASIGQIEEEQNAISD